MWKKEKRRGAKEKEIYLTLFKIKKEEKNNQKRERKREREEKGENGMLIIFLVLKI